MTLKAQRERIVINHPDNVIAMQILMEGNVIIVKMVTSIFQNVKVNLGFKLYFNAIFAPGIESLTADRPTRSRAIFS